MSTEELTYRQKAAATKRARSRQKILEAARPLLDEHGWYHTTREQVAQAAGLGNATVFSHFATKRDMVVAAYEPELQPLIDSTEEAVTLGRDAEEALATFVRSFVTLMTERRTLCRALLPIGRMENPADEFHPQLLKLIDLLAQLMNKHPKDIERFGVTIEQHAKLTLAGMLGNLFPPHFTGDPVEFADRQLRYMIL
ncbi:TetR/AcrR family transcriptional regulator [Streptomyces sp. NBC_01373]|uniref:TetR/AcrR family transcriptional regulator n=1 Tax=Streptomyces sp. NBC_01373 TaxID=2903843 RepID=UPI00224E2011|nr:TetR/AcrR family transcriptional regulator [Streptomyces sp. NBC_01373]MCX4699016.1 TetR/AcrR family transcriptional regulator [Streptomyces sp. NBC_01373]